MIKYDLKCKNDHEFEIWFSKSSDFDDQAPKGLIACPSCGITKVEKAIMAPNVSTSRKKEAIAKHQAHSLKMMNAAADKIRREVENNCDYVGDKFTEEARAMHYGEKDERGIYGEATPEQASELWEEGIGVAPLPDAIAPKPKKHMN